jgi:hypothetical protein
MGTKPVEPPADVSGRVPPAAGDVEAGAADCVALAVGLELALAVALELGLAVALELGLGLGLATGSGNVTLATTVWALVNSPSEVCTRKPVASKVPPVVPANAPLPPVIVPCVMML